jgi:hypothetical protein
VKLQNVVGKPVFDLNFYGRDEELEQVLDASTREHVLMLAPRRVGKTSLLNELVKRAERDAELIAVYVSVSDATTEATFVKKLLDAIYAHKRGRKLRPGLVARAFGHRRDVRSVDVGGVGVAPEYVLPRWQEEGNRAFDAIARSQTPLLLLIDELPIVILAIANSDPSGLRVHAFLQWFRNQRQRADCAHVRFVLAGSIGLDNVARKYALTETINDLRVWHLGPFSRELAHTFLGVLAEGCGIELTSPVRDAMCDVVGWLIPYHLQAVFSELRKLAKRGRPDLAMLDAAVDAALANKSYFAHWDDRLRDAFGKPTDAAARALLDACAADPDGASANVLEQVIAAHAPAAERTAQLRWILDVFGNDGYLVEHAGRWRFRSGLLRRFWTRTPR